MWTLDHAIFASFLTTVVAAVLFGYLFLLHRERHVGYFALFWLLYSLKMTLDVSVLDTPSEVAWPLITQVVTAAMGLTLLKSIYTFSGRRFPGLWLWATLATLTYMVLSYLHLPQTWPFQLPVFAFHAVVFATAAYFFYKTNDFGSFVRPLTMTLLLLWGSIQVAYPLVREIPELALYGYFTSATLKLFLALAMLTGYVRQTKDSLDRGQDNIQRAIDMVPFHIYAKTLSGRFIMANQAVAELYGTDIPTLLARRPGDFPKDGPLLHEISEADREVMATQVAHQVEKEAIRGAKGWSRVMRTTRIPFRAPGVQEKSVLVVSADITDQNQADTDKNRLEEQFRQAQKMESIGRMAGGVAQDFNDLLTGIIGNLDLALMDLYDHDPLRDTLSQLKQAAVRTTELTQQLLIFGRRQMMDSAIVNPNERIEDLYSMLTRLVGPTIRLRLRLSPDVGRIQADPAQLEQILVNLAMNAKDAMPDGGELAIETSDITFDRCTILPDTPGGGAGALREIGDQRHRSRHERGNAQADVRALLHHQTQRHGQRTGAFHRVRHRQTTPRHHRRILQARLGHGPAHLLPQGQSGHGVYSSAKKYPG